MGVPMVLVEEEHTRVITNALESARAGHPTVLVVEGAPGAGKTTLLRHICARAEGFQIHAAESTAGDQRSPFHTLGRWGVALARGADGSVSSPFVVAQQLREVVDNLSAHSPVLLQVDDVQWADPESVRALTWLLERADGDRLLVVVGARPLAPREHDAWQRFVAASGSVQKLALNGLSLELSHVLIQRAHPDLSLAAAHYLWEHTGGNPLYLTSLLRENNRAELSRMRALPAPAEFARDLNFKIEQLSEPARKVLRAAAVLGPHWITLPVVALVAGVSAPTDAVSELEAQELLVPRAINPGLAVRLPHALVRAAIYQYIPLSERRELHLRAAAVVDDESTALEHRVAAAEQFDDALAAELEMFARDRHADREYRVAAQHYRWSSRVTSDSSERNRRLLDGLFESVLADDLALVSDELAEMGTTKNRARRALVAGAVAVLHHRWAEGARVLAQVSHEETDPLTRYRIEVLLAWARVGAGGHSRDIADGLDRARDQGVTDISLDGYLAFAAGQLAGRVGGADSMVETFRPLPTQAAATPLDLSYLLAWRGAVFVRRGFHDGAIADLSEVERRVQGGLIDISDGIFTAMLGFAHLEAGQVALAETKMRLALDSSHNPRNPMIQALVSSVPVATGDVHRAQEHLDAATNWLQEMPWPEAIESLLIAQVILLHASGNVAAQARFIREHRARFGPAGIDPEGATSPLWNAHIALAFVWAGDLGEATRFVTQSVESPLRPSWVTPMRSWISALISEARGHEGDALVHCNEAEREWPDAMVLYRAHLHVDRARIVARLGDGASARQSRATARGIYERAGAVGYLALLGEPAQGSDTHAALAMLSARERDVVALLAAGLSYAQIARDLYISRSTVGFHLSKIYAKTGTTSRHELTDLVRTSA